MTKAGSKGGNLRDKLDCNELDLSLSDLNEVPVKELGALPEATIMDLSCNKLTTLLSDFCGLTHLVKLDLSKNRLPADFGRLVNLQHLDLLSNRLVTLPVSFAQLKNLKWLDLKDNPLDAILAKVAGDCLDEKQCKQCADTVLRVLCMAQEGLAEREAEKKREAKQRAKEPQEQEAQKREKAEEKERRRKEYDALKAAKREQEKKPKKETNQAPKSKSGSPGQLPACLKK
uniref:Leucine rich repeat containing 59 n=1 Tax=Nomascus leucogenys TaxID=61853 RepID=A0A2I3GNR8_NOMLE